MNILNWAVKAHHNRDNLVIRNTDFLDIAAISGGDELIGLVFVAWRLSEMERFLRTRQPAQRKRARVFKASLSSLHTWWYQGTGFKACTGLLKKRNAMFKECHNAWFVTEKPTGCLYKVKSDCTGWLWVAFFRAYKSVSVCATFDVGWRKLCRFQSTRPARQ